MSHGNDGTVISLVERLQARTQQSRLIQRDVTDELITRISSSVLSAAADQFDEELDLGIMLAGLQLAIRSAVVIFMSGGMTYEEAIRAIQLGTAKSEQFEVTDERR